MRDYEELLKLSRKAQLRKLKQNTHKAGFDNLRLSYIHKRIKEETKELENELFMTYTSGYIHLKDEIDPQADIDEFADIMNFCAMGIKTLTDILKEIESCKE